MIGVLGTLGEMDTFRERIVLGLRAIEGPTWWCCIGGGGELSA